MRFWAGLLAVVLSASSALAQSAELNENVYLTGFDQGANTYSGYVQVTATPCPNEHYGLNLTFANAKNEEDGKAKAKETIDKIAADVREAAKRCDHH